MQHVVHSMLMFPLLEICILVLSVNILLPRNKYNINAKFNQLPKGHNKYSKYINATPNYNYNFKSLL